VQTRNFHGHSKQSFILLLDAFTMAHRPTLKSNAVKQDETKYSLNTREW